MAVMMRVDYRYLRLVSVPFFLLALVLLAVVLLPPMGPLRPISVGGSARWLQLGPLPAIHPAEVAKLALVIYLAHWMAKRGTRIHGFWGGTVPFLIILGILAFTAVFAPLIATHDPDGRLLGVEAGVKQRSGPCIHLLGCPEDQPQHLFGTDGNFRDVFSRVVFGARTSLVVGLAAIGFAIFIGSTIGALAGYMSGWVDNTFMRFMDVLLAFPSLLLAIAIVTATSPSLFNALLAIGIVAIPIYARVARASVLSTKNNTEHFKRVPGLRTENWI
jgi:ABC-type Fe3+ transport system permease subunit